MDSYPPKSPYKLQETITSDDDDLRFRIYSGEIALEEYTKELIRKREKRTAVSYARLLNDLIEARDYYLERELVERRNKEAYKDLWLLANKYRYRAEENLRCFILDYKYQCTMEDISYQILKEERLNNINSINGYKVLVRILSKRLKEYQMGTNSKNTIHSTLNSIQGVNLDMTDVNDNNVIPFDLVERVKNKRLGTDSSASPPENWLSKLKPDTYFVCGPGNPQDPSPIQHEYILIEQGEKSVKLLTNMNEPEMFIRVDPIRFCAIYQLVEVLKEGE